MLLGWFLLGGGGGHGFLETVICANSFLQLSLLEGCPQDLSQGWEKTQPYPDSSTFEVPFQAAIPLNGRKGS